jgi:chemotaxis signal transduction protein/hemoglobin-like flavoprotein
MTPEQIELVKSSWKQVLPIADTAADLFYDRLFEVAPGVRGLFADDMAGQKKALLAMLGRVVASLDNLESIVPHVQDLGVRHVGYGAEPAHYAVVGETLLWTLEKGLGDEWNDELKNAWATAYGVLSSTMIDAANAKITADADSESKHAEKTAVQTMTAEPAVKKTKKRTKRTEPEAKKRSVAVGSKSETAEQASGPHRQLVVFGLDAEQFGLDIAAVREIIRLQEITAVPRAPEFIEGVINLRGKIIPVVCLRKRFDMDIVERDDDFRIVVVDVNGTELGIVVDAVSEVSRIPESSIEPPSGVISRDNSGYLTGIAKTGQAMIMLLDIGSLLTVPEAESVRAASTHLDEAA